MNKAFVVAALAIVMAVSAAYAEDPSDNTLNEIMPQMRAMMASIDVAETAKDRELKMQLLEQIVELRKDLRTSCKIQRKRK